MEQVKRVSKRGQNQLGKKRGPYKKTAAKVVELIEVVAYSKPKRNPKKSRTTVAGLINTATNKIFIHGARNNTSLGEVFRRPIGRKIAIGRAKKNPLMVVDFVPGKAREAFHEAANELMKKPYRIGGHI